MRFAFYGRVSTEDQQDPESSRNWQLARSRQLIEPTGEIVVEFFDVGQSRSLPWSRRPEASKLLQTLADPDRGFDAVVIGEPQRAFYGNQFGLTFPVFVHYGVGLWVPEVGGAVDPGSDAHEIVMNLYGGMSKGERNRIKTRVRTAMAAQAAIEGRYLGGRPPYGYVLADAGPHPNPAKAAAGQTLKKLEPDPTAAPVVQRIFAEYLTGKGLYAIAEGLTADGILSPSAHDPGRNRHRSGSRGAWSKSAVRAILRNPRYTGHQVWNRQRRDEELIDVNDVGLGHQTRMRWNHPNQWIWSENPTHPAIIDAETYQAAQEAFGRTKRRAPRRTGRRYLLSGLIRCGVCGRRMAGQQNHDHPYYRCRFPDEYGIGADQHPRNVYVKESAVTPGLDRWLGTLFDDDHLEETAEILAGSSQPDPDDQARKGALAEQIHDCDRRLGQYQAVLDEGADAKVVARWMAQVQRERANLQAQLGHTIPGGKLTSTQVRALVEALRDIVTVLAEADPQDKAELYGELGVDLTYHPEGSISVKMLPRGVKVRVGGAIPMLTTRPAPLARAYSVTV